LGLNNPNSFLYGKAIELFYLKFKFKLQDCDLFENLFQFCFIFNSDNFNLFQVKNIDYLKYFNYHTKHAGGGLDVSTIQPPCVRKEMAG
jgi:hypothetical protein